ILSGLLLPFAHHIVMARALNVCSFITGRRSITVATLTSAGNIGEDGILGCTFEPDVRLSNVEIRWAKAGVSGMVHEFKGGKDHLKDQDEMFKGRTAVFAEQVIGGNASLMLRDVQLSDAGAYRCSVTTSKGKGEAELKYKTGAFSSPEVHVDYNSSLDSLRCEAPRWFPQPVVIWTSHNSTRDNVSNTSFKLNSGNVTMKVVSVLHNITANTTYTCVIKNDIAKAMGAIKVTGTFHPGALLKSSKAFMGKSSCNKYICLSLKMPQDFLSGLLN
uniref:V-set domain containing T cell activation inhibitor 1 n=1 Tax=Pelusios castaneus TaxID=367368 RepID=A0A8C8RXN3_9SAUR